MAQGPRSQSPQAEGPRSQSPRSEGPRSQSPPSEGPRSEGPRSQNPQSEGPRSEGPRSQSPQSQGPRSEGPRSQSPRSQSPQSQGPRSEGPRSQSPRSQSPRSEGPRSEGPGSKRRKQANPRRKNDLAWSSAGPARDSDEDDWLLSTGHLHPGGGRGGGGGGGEDEPSGRHTSWLPADERSDEFDGASVHAAGNPTATPVDELPHVKQLLLRRPLEDEGQPVTSDPQHSDTAIVYPEAPEELMPFSTPDAIGPDESEHGMAAGVLDAPPQAVVCLFCQRGYKRLSTLSDHILDRYQERRGLFCRHGYAHRVQLERHVTRQQPPVTRQQPPVARHLPPGARHLPPGVRHLPPTHPLRDSGNRKFQCGECLKAFKYKHHLKEHLRIHSGEKPYQCCSCKKRFSHSGSFSSHMSSRKCVPILNGLQNHNGSKPRSSSPGSPAPNQPHSHAGVQRNLHIKREPMDLAESGGVGGDLSLLGYTRPLKNQKGFQTVDHNGCRQDTDQHPETSTPERKTWSPQSTIDYTVEKVFQASGLINEPKRQDGIGKQKLNQDQNHFLLSSFQETQSGTVSQHQHQRYMSNMNLDFRAVLQPETGSDVSTSPGPFKDQNSVLKSYSEPSSEELLKISIAVGLGQEMVTEWFEKWKSQNLAGLTEWATAPDCGGSGSSCVSAHSSVDPLDRFPPQSNTWPPLNLSSASSKTLQGSSYTPTCQTSEEFHRDGPLDLSLSRPQVLHTAEARPPRPDSRLDVAAPQSNSGPSDSISMRTEVLGPGGGGNSAHLPEEASGPFFGLNTFAGCPDYASPGLFPPPACVTSAPATVHVLGPYASLDPISFLPHLAYTYAYTGASNLADLQARRKLQRRPAFQGALQPAGLEATESVLCRKKKKKTDSGMYACDLCDKTFQKTSSLLRHKYEHTGQRPHQCVQCHKAFKHKHHLVEHSRLHSGEKPYRCDRCGKRFSHSGSYSQHMNHRYSYCKREAQRPGPGGGPGPAEVLDPVGPSRPENQ